MGCLPMTDRLWVVLGLVEESWWLGFGIWWLKVVATDSGVEIYGERWNG